MTPRQPVLFVSHGAPDLLLNPGATGALWRSLGEQLPRPRAIVVASAHWESAYPAVTGTVTPETVHDFFGFPPALYAKQYDAPGEPALAGRVAELLAAADMPARIDTRRGLDHGAWAPLSCLYPEADIPVVQLALVPRAGADWHRTLGAALRPLRDEGVLILASGAVTHNFGWLSAQDAPPYPPAAAFADWVGETLETAPEALATYREQAPYGAGAHPTEEHLLPLFVASGAADAGDRVARLRSGFTYGGLAMDAWLWQPAATGEEALQ